MARPPRIEYPGAIYHVTTRGVEQRAIVADRRDRDRWLEQLHRVVERHRWRMFAFALMDNHFHLFLQTPDANLSVGMRDLSGGYATFFNTRHERSGHLFQGRFKAFLVDDVGYWLEVSRYVHLNPVRAGLVAKPEAWPWSSYAGYHRPARRRSWMDYPRVLEEFGGDTSAGRRRYRQFIQDGLGRELDSPLAAAWHNLVLGSDGFVERIEQLLGGSCEEAAQSGPARGRPRPTLEDVLAAVADYYGIDRSAWAPGRRSDGPARAVAAYFAHRLVGEASCCIAEALGYRDPSSVIAACRRIDRAPKRSSLTRDVERLARTLASGADG